VIAYDLAGVVVVSDRGGAGQNAVEDADQDPGRGVAVMACLAVRTDPGRRAVRAWSIVPAAVNDRATGTGLVCGDAAVMGALLLTRGSAAARFAAAMTTAGIEVISAPTRVPRRTMPAPVPRLIARDRNRVEASFKEITDQMERARHRAHSFEGLLARTAATLAARALLHTVLTSRE
jgi:hypothetical protein